MMLRKRGDGHSEVVRGEGSVVILGGGPSLTQAQIDFVRGKARVIAINNAYLRAPWADVLYAPDARWWRKHGGRLELLAFEGQRCCLDATNHPAGAHRLRYRRDVIWSDRPDEIGRCEHGHAGYQALNMAALAGGDPIILLGYDAHDSGPANWHNEHPWERARNVSAKMRRSFEVGRPEIECRGLRVINCSPGSAIDVFPTMTLEEAIAACAEPVTG
jgi:hypothetical protein